VPAVTAPSARNTVRSLPSASGVVSRRGPAQRLGRGVASRAFVGVDHGLGLADGAGLEVRLVANDGVGANFGEFAVVDGLDRLLMALIAEFILVLARDAVFLRDLLGGDAHAVGDADIVVFEYTRIHRDLVAHHGHHGHGLGAAGDHHVGLAQADPVGGHGHGLQPGRAEAVDGHARHRVRQTGQQRAYACNIHALLGLGHCATDDHVLDHSAVDFRDLFHCFPDDMCQKIVGPGIAETALEGLCDRRANSGNYVGITHA